MRQLNITVLLLVSLLTSRPVLAENISPQLARQWIEEMKQNERGPFSQIRWFCKDGKILPPTRVGCAGHGGGIQHGELNSKAETLRAQGYPLATLYAEFSESDIRGIIRSPKELSAMLLERYLIIADEGWIFRKALFYRGAIQAEDESEGAEKLLLQLLSYPEMYENKYLLVRESARLLAIDKDSSLLQEVRSAATRIANQNNAFIPMRNKLHTFPEPSDVETIRNFGTGRKGKASAAKKEYNDLAAKLERVFSSSNLTFQGNIILNLLPPSVLKTEIQKALEKLNNPSKTVDIFWALSDIIYYIRKYFNEGTTPDIRRRLLIFSLHAERTLFKKWTEVEESGALKSRYDNLQFLLPILQANYGCGLMSERTYQAAAATINEISNQKTMRLPDYLRELRYLLRVSEWSSSEVEWEFYEGLELMSEIEPRVNIFVDERLHASLLLAYSQVLDRLNTDASQMSGMRHYVIEGYTSSDVRALNPGLAHGKILIYNKTMSNSDLHDKIVLVENTEADLPPVAGILTLNEGSSLSHVELLARNLGIPNAVVRGSALSVIQAHAGDDVVLAVSPAGRVEIKKYTADWKEIFEKARAEPENSVIKPDMDRIDLDETELIPLTELSLRDSGKTVGPKAARLGDLKQMFPDLVSNGLAIPFGVFYQVLDQPFSKDQTLYEWMQQRYGRLLKLSPLDKEYNYNKEVILGTVKDEIQKTILDEEFITQLKEVFKTHIGDPETTGVFVRSDTNVEDLPGFTGAGLNLTVPNVIGFKKVISAIKEVWGSPFNDRAFGWRQGKMTEPENVFTSVLLQKTVNVDKSGVLVSSDLESGSRQYFTVAANSGVGGAVNNQFSESLVVNRESGKVKLLSEARARSKQVAVPSGGMQEQVVVTKERILDPKEIAALTQLVSRVEENYKKLKNSEGQPVPADIEFGFLKGKLYLFQIRPYLESLAAKKNNYLLEMDKDISNSSSQLVPIKRELFSKPVSNKQ